MEMLLPIILIIIVVTLVLLYLVGNAKNRKEQQAKEAEVKEKQEEAKRNAKERKRLAGIHKYTETQLKRLQLLKKFEQLPSSIEYVQSDLLMVIGNADKTKYNSFIPAASPEFFAIFEDEVIPSKAMKEKYHLLPMSREEFLKTYFRNGGFVASYRETETVYVQDKQKSVVGSAVKGAIIAGGAGAVVGAIAAADKNNHAKGHYELRATGNTKYVSDWIPEIAGLVYNEETDSVEEFTCRPNLIWINNAINKTSTEKGAYTYYLKKYGRAVDYPGWKLSKNEMTQCFIYGKDRHNFVRGDEPTGWEAYMKIEYVLKYASLTPKVE